ncbi:uncharacterized protein L969DRAFT_92444 [Mixia osmundae IAM 14324]|uniref:hydroxymethylglutaryl-CoA lyase n=1 Tax=Mixia osmundae (strain CBS 9802 / IAM 14324 / JCM 22182 / KY 12970) TaxID=764103 RepID=G7DXI6_MIXOS|nr:uncharacterized protein L969DRAFT_92444 [Mixia osmundae IAM 14324]KEI41210.1 hypothetical protein L969DRAFT_92444 [Mixia osmundae IAM 14324]GAA95296.1 hypothetical protein E5Q_01953 [Mixia osmundae IAM 14324]
MALNLARSVLQRRTTISLPPTRLLATVTSPQKRVNIVEVGARDGLQNEQQPVSIDTRVELISRLVHSGLKTIEGGAFVSPKWVPQMKDSHLVLEQLPRQPQLRYPVLTPNLKALENFVQTNSQSSTDEICIFLAVSNGFNRANINRTTPQAIDDAAQVTQRGLELGLRVRGYLSTAVGCPFEGVIAPEATRALAKQIDAMGCYQVVLSDTIGVGTPLSFDAMFEAVLKDVPVEKLAVHCHDTYGTAIANIVTSLDHGVRTIDSSVAGLGGCPYAPGATGNVATEDVLFLLEGMGYQTGVNLQSVAETGAWISQKLGRRATSAAGLLPLEICDGSAETLVVRASRAATTNLKSYRRPRLQNCVCIAFIVHFSHVKASEQYCSSSRMLGRQSKPLVTLVVALAALISQALASPGVAAMALQLMTRYRWSMLSHVANFQKMNADSRRSSADGTQPWAAFSFHAPPIAARSDVKDPMQR